MANEPVKTSLSNDWVDSLLRQLAASEAALSARCPVEPSRRQPVHVMYGGAHLFSFDTARKVGALARRALEEHAPDFVALARALEMPGAGALPEAPKARQELEARLEAEPLEVKASEQGAWLAHAVFTRVRAKLEREPVEDYRLDFEDGYGVRPDAEEDDDAARAARELARGLEERTLPPFIGIRVKSLSCTSKARAIRTLDIVLTTLMQHTPGRLPEGFVVTVPKVEGPEQVRAAVAALEALERALGLPAGALKLELMVELTQTLIGADGRLMLPALRDAAQGRLIGAHFGTYDYTASCDVTAVDQRMSHPACDFARHLMQVAFARSGVFLSDGATNVMPIGPHRAAQGLALSPAQQKENHDVVLAAWRLSYRNIRDSLERGFFQGWDLHPAQVPVRYAATYAYFLGAMDGMARRLKNFVDQAAKATLVGAVFDDAATGQGLLNFFSRAITCGAATEEEIAAATGLTLEELRSRSFPLILERRKSETSSTG